MLRLLMVTLASVLIPSAAAVAESTMTVEFTGLISSGSDPSNALGLGETLEGQTITGLFTYDPDSAPPDDDSNPDAAIHQSMGPASAWFALPQLFIGGVPVPTPDFSLITPQDGVPAEDFASVILEDRAAPVGDSIEYLRFQAANDGGSNFADYTLQLGLFGDPALLDAASLTAPIEISDLVGVNQLNSAFSFSTPEGFEVLVNEFALTGLSVAPAEPPIGSTIEESMVFGGDFSGDEQTPTDLGILAAKTLVVSGATGPVESDIDDYFLFRVPEGRRLRDVSITQYQSGPGNESTVFEIAAAEDGVIPFDFLITSKAPDSFRLLTSDAGPYTIHVGEAMGPASWAIEITVGLLGDFNADGVVDAADYAVWRDNLGAMEDGSVLAGNGDGGVVDSDDYALWRDHFGTSLSSLVSTSTAIPEPSAMVLLLGGLVILARRTSQAWGPFNS